MTVEGASERRDQPVQVRPGEAQQAAWKRVLREAAAMPNTKRTQWGRGCGREPRNDLLAGAETVVMDVRSVIAAMSLRFGIIWMRRKTTNAPVLRCGAGRAEAAGSVPSAPRVPRCRPQSRAALSHSSAQCC